MFFFRFFQIPISKKPDQLTLNSYSEDRVREFWKYSSSIQNFILKTLLIICPITMSFLATSYVIMMWKYSQLLPFLTFWTILITNYISLIAIGTMCIVMESGLITYLYLVCKILRERFDIITSELHCLVRNKSDLHKLKTLLDDFNLNVDDLQKSDHFWSKFIFWNYHFATLNCSVLFLTGKFLCPAESVFFNVNLMLVL